jgi:hypothetical protein
MSLENNDLDPNRLSYATTAQLAAEVLGTALIAVFIPGVGAVRVSLADILSNIVGVSNDGTVTTIDATNLVITNAPTSDPAVTDQVWANSDVITLSSP